MIAFGALPGGLDRPALLAAVSEGLAVVAPAAGVVVAVSGGPDSVALAHLVHEARPDLRLVVAHVRHGLRDDAEDAAVAAAHAETLAAAFVEHQLTVPTDHPDGPEAAARTARYAALAAVAEQTGAPAVLTGHSADDQAETVLLNIGRGTGLRGLGGMQVVRELAGGVVLVRPLLRIRRSDLRHFLEGEGLASVADPTNADLQRRRNHTRHLLLPALGAVSGGTGDPVGVLSRLADLARQDADALDGLASERAAALVVPWGPAAAAPLAPLRALHPALGTRVVRRMVAVVRGDLAGIDADSVARVLGLRSGGSLHLDGGIQVTAGGGWLAVAPGQIDPLLERTIQVPGETELGELGLVLHADRPRGVLQPQLSLGAQPPPAPPAGPLAAPPGATGDGWVCLAEPAGVLVVRSRRPGERIRLTAGSRKLQDVFVDAGVPRALRPLVPVVATAEGEIVWVPGLAVRHQEEQPRLRLRLAPKAADSGALRSAHP